MKQPFGVIDENVGDVFALRGIMLSSDDNRPSDQSEAADCQNSHHDVFLCHPTGTIGIPPVPVIAHSSALLIHLFLLGGLSVMASTLLCA